MKPTTSLILVLLLVLTACSQTGKTVKVTITNPSGVNLKGAVFSVTDKATLQKIINSDDNFYLESEGVSYPFQLIKGNGDPVKLLVLADLNAGEKKVLQVVPSDSPISFKPKTQAMISVKKGGEWIWVTKSSGKQQYEYRGGTWEDVKELKVPKQHTDHSFDIRIEGPGWESDKIGYRFYLDWRNAIDLFGKKVDTLVLQNVGLDGFDSYHEMAGWGVDILDVGNSLGVGSMGHWAVNRANRVEKTDSLFSRVDCSGTLESQITTIYSGWETDEGKTGLTSRLSIRAGSYLTKNELELSKPLNNICTGIVKFPDTTVLKSDNAGGPWAYLATFGKQTIQGDDLGMAVFYNQGDLIELADDSLNHVVILKPKDNKLTYYFGAVWEQDSSHIKTVAEFDNFLKSQLELLNNNIL